MAEPHRIFSLRLPQGFHGPIRPYKRLSAAYKQKSFDRQNPQLGNLKTSNWQTKRLDKDVVQQRRQMLVHVAKISREAPEWWKTTYNYFRRNQAPQRHKPSPSQNKKFDVFNQLKEKFYHSQRSDSLGVRGRIKQVQVTGKIGSEMKTCSNFYSSKDVSAKVGSVEVRNFSTRRPQLKIGREGFVDTYSIF